MFCLFESPQLYNQCLDLDHQIRLEKSRIIYYSIFPRNKLLYSLKNESKLVFSRYLQNQKWEFIFKNNCSKYKVVLNTKLNKATVKEYERKYFRKDKFIQEHQLNILDPSDNRVFVGRVAPFI